MAIYHAGFENIKVKLISFEGNNLGKKVYEFGRLSHDFPYTLINNYNENHQDCTRLIDKIIEGTTLPKFALQGTRIEFRIENISRICLAQITRDTAIFASASGGVYPLTQDFNIPLSIYSNESIMDKLKKAQDLLEDAYIMACEEEIPVLEARYLGLHCQTISLTASYTPSDFVRSCYSRTSSNFCDECNYVYRLMYKALIDELYVLTDLNSVKLWNWIVNDKKCINDDTYTRERLYCSDFTDWNYNAPKPAINDWRKSGWKKELERMYNTNTGYLTEKEKSFIQFWLKYDADDLPTSYEQNNPDNAINYIKTMHYYNDSVRRKKDD